MKKVQGIYLSVAVAAVVIAGCATSHFRSTRNPADANFEQLNGNYDKIHPLYAIECASSKYDSKAEVSGGPYGHTFVYLKGACRDKSVGYPKIKVCDQNKDPGFLDNPESGVGLALDKTFQNTRYIPTDGYNFLINGDLAANAPLDTEAYKAAIKKLVDDGDAKGIILQKKFEDQKGDPKVNKGDLNMSNEEWIANEVVGSSFAVDFARNLGCVAVPINDEMLAAAVNYVNEQNEPFVTGKKKFKWSPVSDQCVQFVHNIFAAMGIGRHITTANEHNWLVQKALLVYDFSTFLIPFVPSQMPAPVNELDKTDEETTGAKVYTLQEAWKNKTVRENFNKFHRIIATDGVLIWTHSAHTTENQYFNVGAQLIPVDFPGLNLNARMFRKLTESPGTAQIRDNLTIYQAKLQATMSSMDIEGSGIESQEYCDLAAIQNKTPNDSKFKQFCMLYTKYLRDAKSDAEDHMKTINGFQQ